MSDFPDDERTDPNVVLPDDVHAASLRQTTPGPSVGGEAQPLPPRPPTLPPRGSSVPSRPPLPPPPPLRRSAPPRPPERRPSVPPGAMPRPSDPPSARTEPSAIDRQRIAALEAQLHQARETIARQRSELDALRARADAGEARLRELEARAVASEALEELARRVEALEEAQRPALVPRHDDELARRVEALEARLRALEEGTAESRIRMRLERAGHRIEELERRLSALEGEQRPLVEAARESAELEAAREARLARLESLFEELAEEVAKDRDTGALDELRARLDDVESLVAKTGTREQDLERKLSEQERELATLRESLAPPAGGDDLTRIRGIGPKYARLLGELGVTTFAQIAAWTDEELEHVAERLGIPVARIKKAGWVETAAKLASG